MGIGHNIKLLLDEKGIKQKDFAEMIGESTVNVSRYLKEQRGIPENLYPIISKTLNISIDDFFENKTIKSKFIPLIGKSSCGKPKDYDLNGYEPVPVPVDMYKEGMYAVEADGDSMSPKINDGDIVYCQPNRIIDNGNIVHYWLNGESGIKKYKMNEQGTIISLIPINSDYDIITIHCDDKHELIMARVVGKIDRDF
ncbi:XRE family transcriptional regulator [Aliarcobacter butzleri]|uniref:LexA family protein n=1 Tax=Aliarcobacter butzleri TaxID=28197 RepID=UPI0021B41C32|nr:XRE family transcriptional regulator [Aliarcobacter butzleri]UXC28591.1 XRE family transcriptional regulator [Aliarcobacter butzleri]UXC29206.1 XRE family transcriptional regulator [Aliarcobacter butzleri]